MSAGTLTLTNKSAAVTGSGTAFTTEVAAGDFIVVTVGGIPYTLAIKTVNSNTSLTLVSSYTGPTQAGAAWYAVPRVAMNLVTAALVAQSAEALRGLNYDKQNWQSIFSGTGNVTVTLPDGSSFTGPAWNSFTTALNGKADKVSGAVPVNQGGTGATTVESARSNLGLGTAATKDTGVASGQVLLSGANGLCGLGNRIYASGNMATYASLRQLGCGFFRNDNEAGVTARYGAGFFSSVMGSHAIMTISAVNAVPVVSAATDDSLANNIAFANTLYGTANTTKSSDGTLKAASPVARIVASQEACQRADIAEDGFSWCGCGTANAEAEGITISHLEVGVYVLAGSAGLASEGWQLLPPMDPGGMGELGVVEAEQTESGGLTVRLFKQKYMLNDEGEIIKTKGTPMDVPSNSWIDVRLDMPENSVWNLRQKAAMEAADNESGS
ncbi:phage tail protein [Enterobacter kobei]|uniref:phage tail fiber protein n=1 Tax=Enterobacter kobei TaxID=208224 RepID=UPI001F15CB93|nr:phage tail protein [Enterobacter kobei]MCF1287917.1 phage tail protein [Enterobacter kobei]MCS4605615.1 phage tail protein [Enterobacter kobei]MDV1943825.1 phage tail protein [Enterobacter kobei]HDR2394564.1 phage tail protein [Enterobacter kobei]